MVVNSTVSTQSLPTEHARQVFSAADSSKTGSIPALEFVEIMLKIRKYRMSVFVQDNLLSVSDVAVCHVTLLLVM